MISRSKRFARIMTTIGLFIATNCNSSSAFGKEKSFLQISPSELLIEVSKEYKRSGINLNKEDRERIVINYSKAMIETHPNISAEILVLSTIYQINDTKERLCATHLNCNDSNADFLKFNSAYTNAKLKLMSQYEIFFGNRNNALEARKYGIALKKNTLSSMTKSKELEAYLEAKRDFEKKSLDLNSKVFKFVERLNADQKLAIIKTQIDMDIENFGIRNGLLNPVLRNINNSFSANELEATSVFVDIAKDLSPNIGTQIQSSLNISLQQNDFNSLLRRSSISLRNYGSKNLFYEFKQGSNLNLGPFFTNIVNNDMLLASGGSKGQLVSWGTANNTSRKKIVSTAVSEFGKQIIGSGIPNGGGALLIGDTVTAIGGMINLAKGLDEFHGDHGFSSKTGKRFTPIQNEAYTFRKFNEYKGIANIARDAYDKAEEKFNFFHDRAITAQSKAHRAREKANLSGNQQDINAANESEKDAKQLTIKYVEASEELDRREKEKEKAEAEERRRREEHEEAKKRADEERAKKEETNGSSTPLPPGVLDNHTWTTDMEGLNEVINNLFAMGLEDLAVKILLEALGVAEVNIESKLNTIINWGPEGKPISVGTPWLLAMDPDRELDTIINWGLAGKPSVIRSDRVVVDPNRELDTIINWGPDDIKKFLPMKEKFHFGGF